METSLSPARISWARRNKLRKVVQQPHVQGLQDWITQKL